MYTALQTKLVDGQENPYAIIDTAKLYEVQKYLSVTNHMWSAYHLLGNLDAWNALPADVRAIVDRNLTHYALQQRRDTMLRNASLLDKLARRGLDPDLDFHSAPLFFGGATPRTPRTPRLRLRATLCWLLRAIPVVARPVRSRSAGAVRRARHAWRFRARAARPGRVSR